MYYVVQVETGKEQKVIDDLIKAHNSKGLFDVFSPFRRVLRKYKGETREVIERCFPGYIFVETEDAKQLFFDLYEIPGFARLLGREGLSYHFDPLSKEEERMVSILYGVENDRITPISDIEIAEGDEIRILAGPLMDLQGKVKAVDLHKRKATVEISLFQRSVEVQVGINIVTKKAPK